MATNRSFHYELKCLDTGEMFGDKTAPLGNPAARRPAFLRAQYRDRSFNPGPHGEGIYRFERWLPVRRRLAGSSAPITYQSTGIARELGLTRLYITFSGYWPERGCRMLTGTFKECEAYSVCARIPDEEHRVLVVASAGNTARAFARVCSENGIRLLVVIPQRNLESLWSVEPLADCVRVVAAGGDSDYADAISLADAIAALPDFMPEGGAKNVARRDGMGTTVLSAAEHIGDIPQHYFQAVGSGTGAIAAWEASLRLAESGQFTNKRMQIHVSQNSPFDPIHRSWIARSRSLLSVDDARAREQISEINAKVLANRTPPYGLIGGLFDALIDTGGTTNSIDNETAARAAATFQTSEGIDVSPAAAVAVADLVQAAKDGRIGRDETVMLNVTGGGLELLAAERDLLPVRPDRIITREQITSGNLTTRMKGLF